MKIIFLLLLLLQVVTVFSQVQPSQLNLKEDYLKKSKNQKKVANILLIGGGALIATAYIFPRGKAEERIGPPYTSLVYYKNNGIKAGMFFTGVLSMVSSVPLYIISSKNKRKARAITVNLENRDILIPNHNTFILKSQPSLTFKLPL